MTMPDRRPTAFGTGLIALDLVMGMDPESPVKSWAGGTCGNVLSILAYLGWDAYPIGRMNGDPASQRVKADMKKWGVRLDFAGCEPTSHTPIIIQEIRRKRDGTPTHRFSWACPHCGQWLPSYKAVTVNAVEAIAPRLAGSAVFFMDRLSRAALTLAARASAEGAVVIFEPSGKSDPKMFAEALQMAHIVKYADQRLSAVGGVMDVGTATLVEVQTLGAAGLRFRHRLGKGLSDWKALDAVRAPRVADTCGSGDWCTAGLVERLAAGGQKGLRTAGTKELRTALRYGQALAAWNCGFEGARGGMYAIDRAALDIQIDALVSGKTSGLAEAPAKAVAGKAVACPACPPNPRNSARSTNTNGQVAA
jgi:sugar/nucleoside kinase (ribokinase family)